MGVFRISSRKTSEVSSRAFRRQNQLEIVSELLGESTFETSEVLSNSFETHPNPIGGERAKKSSVRSGDRHCTHSPTLYSSNCSRTCRAPASEPNRV